MGRIRLVEFILLSWAGPLAVGESQWVSAPFASLYSSCALLRVVAGAAVSLGSDETRHGALPRHQPRPRPRLVVRALLFSCLSPLLQPSSSIFCSSLFSSAKACTRSCRKNLPPSARRVCWTRWGRCRRALCRAASTSRSKVCTRLCPSCASCPPRRIPMSSTSILQNPIPTLTLAQTLTQTRTRTLTLAPTLP